MGVSYFTTGITNIEFICGKAEDVLPTITNRFTGHANVVAVVDPPRAGLRKVLCIFLLNNRPCRRLILYWTLKIGRGDP